VVERAHAERPLGCGVIAVRDTLAALGDLAVFHRRRCHPRIVAVTGSNGKTTTKEMLAAILARALGPGRVLRTSGTQNNLVGLPLTLLRLAGTEEAAILELGMNGPGEIWRLAQIAEPDVGVITCVAPAHLEGLGSIHGVAEAKAELYRRLRPSATAVVNADDPLVSASARAFPGRKVPFGTAPAAGVTVGAQGIVDRGLEGTEFRLVVERREATIRLAVPGRHNVTNALAAAAAAHALGVDIAAVQAGLEAFQPPGMRMEVTQLPTGVTVLNDAYNANPASMAAALSTLAASRGRRPRRGGSAGRDALPAPLSAARVVPAAQRLQVHHLPHAGGRARRAHALARARAHAHPPALRAADRPGDPQRRPRQPRHQGRHADHGRDAHHLLAPARDPDARRPERPLRVDRAPGDAGPRARRLSRRLRQGAAPELGGHPRARAPGRRVRDRRRRRARSLPSARARRAAQHAVPEGRPPRPGPLVRALR